MTVAHVADDLSKSLIVLVGYALAGGGKAESALVSSNAIALRSGGGGGFLDLIYWVEVTPSGWPTTVTNRPASSRRLATRLVSASVTASIRLVRRLI